MAAGKKRKTRQALQSPKQKHRLSLNSNSDYVVSHKKKRARAHKRHQSKGKKISSDLSSKIIKEALKQQNEILEEENTEDSLNASFPDFSAPPVQEDSGDEEDDVDAFNGFPDTLSQYDGGELEIDEEDEKILATFMRKKTGPQLILADIILQRIKEKDTEIAADAKSRSKSDNIISKLKEVGQFLHQYTSGKITNAFKHILATNLWEDALYLTEPQNWSVNAIFQATKIFSSNMDAKMCRIFYQNILLPRVRDDIRKHRRLCRVLYESLKKALFKPAAFNKGFLFPLCESGTCSLREVDIIGSVIQKMSIPYLHGSAALVTPAQMDYCGTTRYKNELQSNDKDNLHRLMQHQNHYMVTPETMRELRSSRNRGEREEDEMSFASMLVRNNQIEDRRDVPEVPIED